MINSSLRCTAFSGVVRIASGELRHVAMKAKQAFDLHPQRPPRVFDDNDARLLELPLELPAAELLQWLSQPVLADEKKKPRRRPGRPKLGVVAREITLLPEHWDWLTAQPGGASVALRRLVDQARSVSSDEDKRRAAQEAAYRFLQAMASDKDGVKDKVDELARSLFAGEANQFQALLAHWPEDVREHAEWLATDAFLI